MRASRRRVCGRRGSSAGLASSFRVLPDGLGLGLTELALVLEQAGRGLVCEPIGLAAISAAALAQGHAPHPMLERVMAGDGAGRSGAAGERVWRRSACAAHASGGGGRSAPFDRNRRCSFAPTAPMAFSSAPAGAMDPRCATWRATRPAARCRRRRRSRAASLRRSASRIRRPISSRRTRHRAMRWMRSTISR